ncbi:hypothetical protein AMTR_s00049p00178770 [Amborella trichopoda]|uniref:Uncharacterized protein n=1 Tax=Amborella trichopoda TaxID=13333 RepID=W1PUQ1_AMBTC|nr:hypothetical protein AMTR_s00049p00178770 [Amborella trichopoda]
MFVIATLVAIVASQALISTNFSIIRQSTALGCFPQVNMFHTSSKHEGQVYSREVNYFLMLICILIVLRFKGSVKIGNAYGDVVIWVMLITICLMTVVMLVIRDANIMLIGFFFLVFSSIEGGRKKHKYEAELKLRLLDLQQLASNPDASRIPGTCLFCMNLINGIPPIIRHYVQNVGPLRQIIVIVTVRTLAITTVVPKERFHIGKLRPKGVYRFLV